MYHYYNINQALLNKNSSVSHFSVQDSQTDHFNGDIQSYINTCTLFERDIANVFLRYINAPWIKLSNAYVANLVGCSTRTVIRATNKFHRDGFITKQHPDLYATNHYTFSDILEHGKKKTESLPFILDDPVFDDFKYSNRIIVDHKNKMICDHVTPNLESFSNTSLLRIPYPFARAREKGLGFKKPKNQKISDTRLKNGVALVNEFQRKWILDHRTDPRVKDMLNNPRIRSTLLIPPIEKIAQLMNLDDREQLKLIAFNQDTLSYGISCVEPIVTGKKVMKSSIDDKMGWLISILTAYCKNNSVKPDWKWYYDICEIIGIDPKTVGDKKPLITSKTLSSFRSGMYAVWNTPVKAPIEDRIEELRIKLQKHEENFARVSPKAITYDFLKRIINETRQELNDLEIEHLKKKCNLESSNEKKILSNQYNSHRLETCLA